MRGVASSSFGVETNSIGMQLKLILPGTFTMGEGNEAHKVTLTNPFGLGVYDVTQGQWKAVMSTTPWESETHDENGEILHKHTKHVTQGDDYPATYVCWDDAVEFCRRLTLTKPFFMGTTEVTQAQFFRVLRKNPSKFKAAKHPVEQVTWDEAVEFCGRLSDLPSEKRTGRIYRLPTEAEWEHACRAGTTTVYHFGNDRGQLSNYGWWKVTSGSATHPVELKKRNRWGLL